MTKLSHQPKSDCAYPYIQCSRHEGLQRAYVICKHVVAGSKPDKVVLADDQDMGTSSCAQCIDKANRGARAPHKFLAVVCEKCAIEHGLLITP